MNATTSHTTVNVNTTTAAPRNSIKRSLVYDYKGRARVIEKVRGIQV
jgi:hypothetical protein